MENMVYKKLEDIENLLKLINLKIDNFLGFENLTDEEKNELESRRSEMNNGSYAKYEDVFED